MTCDEAREGVVNALTEASEPEENIQQHLRGCHECRAFRTVLEQDHEALMEYAQAAEDAVRRIERHVTEHFAGGSPTHLPSRQPNRRSAARFWVPWPTSRRLTAAVIVFSLTGGLLAAYLTGLFGRSEPAFASMLEQVRRATSVTYRETFTVEDREPFSTQTAIREDGRMRSVMEGRGAVTIIDFNEGITVSLHPQNKKALITQRLGRRRIRGLLTYIAWLKSLHKDSGIFVGQEVLDGENMDLFDVRQDRYRTFKIWVDPDTQLPARAEMVSVPAPGIVVPRLMLRLGDFGGESSISRSISISSSSGIQSAATIVKSDFRWNVTLNDALFDLTPPPGYDVERRQMDVSRNGEQDLVRALETWAELAGGQFPYSIDDLGDQEKVPPLLVAKYDRAGKPEDELDAALQTANVLLKGLMFAQEMKLQREWYYAGDGVRPGDGDTPLCWWLREDADTYRVLFGDLRIANLTTEELQQVLAPRR